jgi:hypothetical protein
MCPRHVSPEVAQKNLEEYFKNLKRRVDLKLVQRVEQEESKRVKERVFQASQSSIELLPESDGPRKRRKSKFWFRKSGAHSLEDPTSTEREKVAKRRKWSTLRKGQYKRELIELEKSESFVLTGEGPEASGSCEGEGGASTT